MESGEKESNHLEVGILPCSPSPLLSPSLRLWGGISIPEYSTAIPSSFTYLSHCHNRSVTEGFSQAASASCRKTDYSHRSLLSARPPCVVPVLFGLGGGCLFHTLGPVKQAGEHSKTSKETDRIVLGIFFFP